MDVPDCLTAGFHLPFKLTWCWLGFLKKLGVECLPSISWNTPQRIASLLLPSGKCLVLLVVQMKVTETSGYCVCLQFLILLKAIREEEEEASFCFSCWIEQESGILPRHALLKVTLNLYWERLGEFPFPCWCLFSKLFLCFTSVSLWTWQNRLLRNTLEGIWTVAVHLFFMVLHCKALRLVKHQRTNQRGSCVYSESVELC